MFPVIHRLEDLLPHVAENWQIRVKVDEGTGHTVVCYMVQDEDTFAGEKLEFERECRGISFDKHGNISARTMHKFFNVGERPETLPTSIRWPDVVRIMEKRDGSMVTPVLMADGSYKFKTKKSFSTPEAALADEIAQSRAVNSLWIKEVLREGMTPTFEVTSPRFPIVVLYPSDELTLLHIRVNSTGVYLTQSEIDETLPPFRVVKDMSQQFMSPGVPANIVSCEKIKEYIDAATGVEGLVLQFNTGEMVKWKTPWYISLHHSVTFTRWRDIARTVCADQGDDLKSAFSMVGRSLEPILKVEADISNWIQLTESTVQGIAASAKRDQRTIKEVAIALKDHELFSLIMKEFRDQEVDYMAHYVKHHLEEDWGLEVVKV